VGLIRKSFLSLIALMMIQGCAHYGPMNKYQQLESIPNKSRIYIYNSCSPMGIDGSGPSLWINDKKVAYLASGSYYGTNIEPGKTRVRTGGVVFVDADNYPNVEISGDLKPGTDTYVEFSVKNISTSAMYNEYKHMLQEVPESIGKDKIKNCIKAKASNYSQSDAPELIRSKLPQS